MESNEMGRFGMFVVLVFLGFCLSGCAGMQARYHAARAAQQAAINEGDDTQCRQYGVASGSDAYVACRMNLANNRQRAEAAQQQAYSRMVEAGVELMKPPPVIAPPSPSSQVCIGRNNALYRC